MLKSIPFGSVLAVALLAPHLAFATTYVVDSHGGAGVDFLDIPPAIAFAAPGDVLLVRPGTYSGFALTKPLSILGRDSSELVTTSVNVHDLAAGSIASLVNLNLQGSTVQISNCNATVIGDGWITSSGIWVSGSADVRLRSITRPNPNTAGGLRVIGSRVELVDSSLRGAAGDPLFCDDQNQADPGWPAVQVDSGEIHVARCNLFGGQGGDTSCSDPGICFLSGNGGDGLQLGPSALGLITGLSSQDLIGGPPGHCYCQGGTGSSGHGLSLGAGAQARYSGVYISSILNAGGTLDNPSPADPSMYFVGTPSPGADLSFYVNAPVGWSVTLNAGRRPIVQPIGGLQEDVLVETTESYDLGTVPAQGSVGRTIHIPLAWTSGTTVVFQAVASPPLGSQVRRTHSIPIVVR